MDKDQALLRDVAAEAEKGRDPKMGLFAEALRQCIAEGWGEQNEKAESRRD